MPHRMKPAHGRPARAHNLRRPRSFQVFEQDVPRVYPFMLGYGGMGTINSEEVMNEPALQASPSVATGTAVEQPLEETGQIAMVPSPASATSNTSQTPYTLVTSQTSSVSVPTPVLTSSMRAPSTVVAVSTPSTTSILFTIPTPTPVATPIPVSTPTSAVVSSSSLVAAVTVLVTSETSSSFSPTIIVSSSIEVVTLATPTLSPTATSAVQKIKEKHPYALYAAFGLMVLILLCVIFASIAWIIRRRRRSKAEAENQEWIGSVLNDEPDDKDMPGPERGRDAVEPGMAGIGAVRREPTYPPLTPTLSSSWNFQDAPIPSNNNTFGNHYGTPTHQPWRHASILERGPAAIDGARHGLDDDGLTFRQDPNGGLTFDPRGTGPHETALYPNPHAPPTFVSTAPSHYSYGGAGPFAVTNLMPGDISSRTSETSLGRTGEINLDRPIPPGLVSNASGGPAQPLGLPTGPSDDPNPWRRYEGVENRGGATGAEDYDKGWGAIIKSGIYSAVGRIVGSDETKPAGNEETKSSERESDRFTELVRKRRPRREWNANSATSSECDELHLHHDRPDDDTDGAKAIVRHSSLGTDRSGDGRPINWLERKSAQHMVPDSRGWIVEEFPDGSRGKIHVVAAGARDRILRRLGSNASVATWTTVYSTDTDPIFSSESTTTTRANTIATSRRDTISTRRSGCVMDRSRGPSTASSDWGTTSVAKALGMSFAGRARDDRHGN